MPGFVIDWPRPWTADFPTRRLPQRPKLLPNSLETLPFTNVPDSELEPDVCTQRYPSRFHDQLMQLFELESGVVTHKSPCSFHDQLMPLFLGSGPPAAEGVASKRTPAGSGTLSRVMVLTSACPVPSTAFADAAPHTLKTHPSLHALHPDPPLAACSTCGCSPPHTSGPPTLKHPNPCLPPVAQQPLHAQPPTP